MKQLAVLGSPIGQALSPVLHRAAHQALGLNWAYRAIACTPEQLAAFLTGMDDSWAGLSLTMPLKRAAVPLLDDVSQLVKATGTANTVVVCDGRLLGENTDVHGTLQALRETGTPRAESACVLGTGATAATALAALHTLGCTEVTAIARDPRRTTDLASAADRIEVALRIRPWTDAPGASPQAPRLGASPRPRPLAARRPVRQVGRGLRPRASQLGLRPRDRHPGASPPGTPGKGPWKRPTALSPPRRTLETRGRAQRCGRDEEEPQALSAGP